MGGLARNLPRPAHSVMRALARPNPIAMTALRLLLTSILLCLALPFAQAAAEDDFLDPERAFVLSARALDARRAGGCTAEGGQRGQGRSWIRVDGPREAA